MGGRVEVAIVAGDPAKTLYLVGVDVLVASELREGGRSLKLNVKPDIESRYLDSYKTQAGSFNLETFARGAVGQVKVRPAGLQIGALDGDSVVQPVRLDHRPGTGGIGQMVN